MKLPPTNNSIDGFETYDDEPYFADGPMMHVVPAVSTPEEFNPPVDDTDFSEYMWMENEEEFEKEEMQRLLDEELMKECIVQHMLHEEHPPASSHQNTPIENDLANLNIQPDEEKAKSSTLNPHAAEFVPSWRRPTPEVKSS